MDQKIVRESSFRHIYVSSRKDDFYTNLKIKSLGGNSLIK